MMRTQRQFWSGHGCQFFYMQSHVHRSAPYELGVYSTLLCSSIRMTFADGGWVVRIRLLSDLPPIRIFGVLAVRSLSVCVVRDVVQPYQLRGSRCCPTRCRVQPKCPTQSLKHPRPSDFVTSDSSSSCTTSILGWCRWPFTWGG